MPVDSEPRVDVLYSRPKESHEALLHYVQWESIQVHPKWTSEVSFVRIDPGAA